VFSVAFSPDGKYLASGAGDETVKLWDVRTGREVHTLRGHTGSVYSVAFSPDGKYLASGSHDGTVKLWDVATGRCIRTLEGHTDDVNSVAFSPDGKYLASGSEDNTVKLWDLRTGECIRTLKGHTDWVPSVAFSPDGKFLAWAGRGWALWDMRKDEVDGSFFISGCTFSVTFSPNGKFLAVGWVNYDFLSEHVFFLDLRTGQCWKLKGVSGSKAAFSPDGRILAIRSCSKWKPLYTETGKRAWYKRARDVIKLWDMKTWKTIHTLKFYGGINSVAFSPDARFLAASGWGVVKLWSIETLLPGSP